MPLTIMSEDEEAAWEAAQRSDAMHPTLPWQLDHGRRDWGPELLKEVLEHDGDEVEKKDLAELQRERPPKNCTPCRYWWSSKCNRGEDCQFSHDEMHRVEQKLSWEPGVCRFFMKDNCREGKACQFLHDEEVRKQQNEAEEAPRDQPHPLRGSRKRLGRLLRTKKLEKYPGGWGRTAPVEEIQEAEEEQQRWRLQEEEDKKRLKGTRRPCRRQGCPHKHLTGPRDHGYCCMACRENTGHTGNCTGPKKRKRKNQ